MLALDERRRREVVDVVDGPHHDGAGPGRAGVPVADPAGGPGGDAVLGVEDDGARRTEHRPSRPRGRRRRRTPAPPTWRPAAGRPRSCAGAAVGRKSPAAGSPRATRRTSTPSASSASPSESVWTRPPRGRVEWQTSSTGRVDHESGSSTRFGSAGGEGGGGQGGPPGGGRHDAAGLDQGGPLGGQALGVAVGAEHVGHDGRAPPAGPDVGADRGEAAGGIVVGAVAEDDVEQDDGHVGSSPLPRAGARCRASGSIIGWGGPW